MQEQLSAQGGQAVDVQDFLNRHRFSAFQWGYSRSAS
jgi:hypothetical protein